MKNLIIAVAILAFFAGMASARGPQEAMRTPYDGAQSRGTIIWYDDIETGAPGWTHGDDSVPAPMWHIDSYMAYAGNSWWCGAFIDADGGYGNQWKQWLTSPYITLDSPYCIVNYNFRYDCESGYDYGYSQAESSGVFVNLNRGYTGTAGWAFAPGFYLGNKDNPAKVRFYFESDAGYSDADGLYQSVGGGMAVDNVQVINYMTMNVLFFDDADDNVGLVPTCPTVTPAGDFWHIASDNCQAYSDPHYWTCTSPDTTQVQPNLQNWLKTPVIDVAMYAPGTACTLFFINQMFMPCDAWGGSWMEVAVVDGFELVTGWWCGDQCTFGSGPYGPCSHFLSIIPLIGPGGFPSGTTVAGKWYMLTDELGNSCDPGTCTLGYCSAGMTIDDTWIEVTEPSAVKDSSWGQIKSLYR